MQGVKRIQELVERDGSVFSLGRNLVSADPSHEWGV